MNARIAWRNILSTLLPLLFLSLLILWFCQDLILREQVPFFRDLGPYFYPLRFILYENLRSGDIPLWNRHMAMGFPFLAAFQSGVFYPPHLLLLIPSFFLAIRVIFICHFLMAGIGAYYLCRNWKFPPYLSMVGALLFALGGTVVSLSNLLNHFQTAVWLPWVILSWEKLLTRTSCKNFLAFTFITATQFLAGSPELFAISMVMVLVDGIRVKQKAPTLSYRKLGFIFLVALLSVMALVMVQVLPTAELFLESRRQHPMLPEEAFHWSLKPVSLINLVFLDKEIDLTSSKGMRLFFGRETPFFVSHYLGAISVLGITLWLYLSARRQKVALLSLTAGSVILALGSHTPVYPFLFDYLPMLGAFRFPEKFFFLSYALLLFMALQGLGLFLARTEDSVKGPFGALAAVGVALAGLYICSRFNLDVVARFIAARVGNPLPSHVHAELVAGAMANLDRQAFLFLGLLLLLVLAKTKAISTSVFGVLIVVAVFVDLASAHRPLLFPLHPGFVDEDHTILQTQKGDPHRFFFLPSNRDLHPSSVTVLGKPTLEESVALSFNNLLPNAGLFHDVDYFQEIDALGRQPYTDFLFFANQLDFTAQIKLLRTFNVKYLVAFRSLPEEGIRLAGRFPDSFSWLYEIEETLPRTYVVNKSVVEANVKQALQVLSSPRFEPAREVVLDSELPTLVVPTLKATAKIVRYENARVTVETSLDNHGILVLADSYYPGWRAFVNGREEVIRRANLFFRAVPLPPGNHTVEFRYEPRSFTVGLAISAATLFALTSVPILLGFVAREPMSRPRFLS